MGDLQTQRAPVVFDTHHHIVRTEFSERQHADLIETIPASFMQAPWIEIEAKAKEGATRKLQSWQQFCAGRQPAADGGARLSRGLIFSGPMARSCS